MISEPLENGITIRQSEKGHRFGSEAVLLVSFAQKAAAKGVVADLGTGTGVLPLLLIARGSEAHFDAVEIDPEMCAMAGTSIEENGLQSRITLWENDLRRAAEYLRHNAYDCVLCNPPFFDTDAVKASADAQKSAARHTDADFLRDMARTAKVLLKNGGKFDLVYPASKLLPLCDALREERLEPKRMRLVGKKLILVEAVKNGKPSLTWETD